MPRGRKEGSGAGGGRQLSGLLPWGPGGAQVPARMPSGLVEGAVPGSPKEGLEGKEAAPWAPRLTPQESAAILVRIPVIPRKEVAAAAGLGATVPGCAGCFYP